MLTNLRIKNLALVSDLAIEFGPGFSAVTGETGAGKSIMIGALNLALGERADRTLIRTGSESCTVEAVFDVSGTRAPIAAFLEENGLEPCQDQALLLKRTITVAGATRQFINGSPAPLATLARLGEWLVDIHGPHEHQSLLYPVRQLAILDAFGQLDSLRESVARETARLSTLREEKKALLAEGGDREIELLRFQAGEIGNARIQDEEDESLKSEYDRASNAARILELTGEALNALRDDEGSVSGYASVAGRALQELQRIDPGIAGMVELHAQAVELIHELSSNLDRYAETVEADPARLRELQERLDLLHSLKRKYGGSMAAVADFLARANAKIEKFMQREAILEKLETEIARTRGALQKAGGELTVARTRLLPSLCDGVVKHLKHLGFLQSRFEITLTTKDLGDGTISPSGFDTVEFQFAPNPGEPVKPLRAIASSGELARVMLAIKTVLAAQDEVPVLVFDEVDANVGGETATAVGAKMRQIGKKRQVLCITHLAPVAAAAEAHYVAVKHVHAGRTISEIQRLEKGERVRELARMLGGSHEAARRHAEALLAEG